jgi:hypothetical protein
MTATKKFVGGQLVAQLHAAGCDPEALAWSPGTYLSACPGCRSRYWGKRLRVITGEMSNKITQPILRCAIGCTTDEIIKALEGGAR